ncbi:hypothetical protein D1632_06105 [Chryseobacterium nematophagum]|uniref:Fibrobacter succinogenes major paralogous domain-containing protein n=1 Tax=Chryseobacterium nematophagum TaxID=2305228 RepID=A0A3M7LB51_9FLAO|nr:FISUMP domain-containing protein [Chryseobacterium nematophagum]RMZ59220.1 hypothetical protein D1632_06105 [Chryseobacterium nematophagum]
MKNNFINLKKILPSVLLLLVSYFYGQVRVVDSEKLTVAFNSSAFIDASSNPATNGTPNIGKGLLFPRTDLTKFNAFSQGPFNGLANNYPYYYDGFIVFNTANGEKALVGNTEGQLCRGFWYYDNPSENIEGGTWRPLRDNLCSQTNPPVITTLNCPEAITTGTLTQGVNVSGVSVQVPYTGGNGVAYLQGTAISSTGVTGLTATLQAGTLANGNGTLTYTISGTPVNSGTAHFAIAFGGQSCDLQVTVVAVSSPVTLNCGGATHYPLANPNIPQSFNPPLFPGTYYTTIPFTGGTGTYGSQTIPSDGQVLGLVATLRAGQMSDHQLIFDISGQTVNSGTATFVFTFQGQTCLFTRNVVSGGGPNPSNPDTVVMCGSSKAWKRHNLGADTSQDADIPTMAIAGNYYQWGRMGNVATPSTPSGVISGYNNNIPDLNSWNDVTKTGNDPCPAGFRVPTISDFENLKSNNPVSNNIGTFIENPSNFGSAVQIRCNDNQHILTLPLTGLRTGATSGGELRERGTQGHYWSSTTSGSVFSRNLSVIQGSLITTNTSPGAVINYNARTNGFNIRCISEN